LSELVLVLPAHRPASPEIAESPTLTIQGEPVPGPSACAAVPANAVKTPDSAQTDASNARRRRIVDPPSW
jgi:hypothetical protein